MSRAAAAPLLLATAAMGTRFELVMADERADGRAVGEAALEEIELWHRRLTRFAPDSLLSHINRTAARAAVRLDRDTFALLKDALRVQEQSGGAFDITVGSRRGRGTIELDPRGCTVRFHDDDTLLDLGGIAKGHAVDCAVALLRRHGIASALLHGGTSSVGAIGAPPDAAGWKVALSRVAGAPVATLRDETLSVSCALSHDTGAGGHIVDPRSGGAAGDTVVAVIGPRARLGDAWATAVAVLGTRPAAMPAAWTTCIARPGASAEWHGPASPRSV